MNLDKKTINIVLLTAVLPLILSGCAYGSKFNCKAATGLPCEMLSSVDRKIDSGEIDTVYKAQCKGRKCPNGLDEAVIPRNEPIKAKLNVPKETDAVIVEDIMNGEEKLYE